MLKQPSIDKPIIQEPFKETNKPVLCNGDRKRSYFFDAHRISPSILEAKNKESSAMCMNVLASDDDAVIHPPKCSELGSPFPGGLRLPLPGPVFSGFALQNNASDFESLTNAKLLAFFRSFY
jgi:hypothetical protein